MRGRRVSHLLPFACKDLTNLPGCTGSIYASWYCALLTRSRSAPSSTDAPLPTAFYFVRSLPDRLFRWVLPFPPRFIAPLFDSGCALQAARWLPRRRTDPRRRLLSADSGQHPCRGERPDQLSHALCRIIEWCLVRNASTASGGCPAGGGLLCVVGAVFGADKRGAKLCFRTGQGQSQDGLPGAFRLVRRSDKTLT